MWHWISEHRTVFGDIGLAWIAPVLLVSIAARLFRRTLFRETEEVGIIVAPDHRVTSTEKPRRGGLAALQAHRPIRQFGGKPVKRQQG